MYFKYKFHIYNDLIYTYHENYTNFKVIPFSNVKIKDYLINYIDVISVIVIFLIIFILQNNHWRNINVSV